MHAALKQWYAQPDDQLEVPLEGFVIDIVRDGLLIEIQTRNFSSLKRKLSHLVEHHRLRLVHPIAQEKWIVRLAADGHTPLGRRKSPRRGRLQDIFHELVSLPQLITSPNFSLEVLLIREEEVRRAATTPRSGRRRRWPRAWEPHDHKLVEIVERHVFESPADYAAFLPRGLTQPFTSRDLAQALDQPRDFASKISYCLSRMGILTIVGKQGRAILYSSDSLESTAPKGSLP